MNGDNVNIVRGYRRKRMFEA